MILSAYFYVKFQVYILALFSGPSDIFSYDLKIHELLTCLSLYVDGLQELVKKTRLEIAKKIEMVILLDLLVQAL